MSPKGSQLERGPAGGEASGPCAACGVVTSKKCSRCKRVRYWCVSSSPVPSWYCLVMGMALHVILRSCRIPSGICRFCFVIWWLVRGIVPGYWYWPSPGVPESNFHNFGLVSCKIGVSGWVISLPMHLSTCNCWGSLSLRGSWVGFLQYAILVRVHAWEMQSDLVCLFVWFRIMV